MTPANNPNPYETPKPLVPQSFRRKALLLFYHESSYLFCTILCTIHLLLSTISSSDEKQASRRCLAGCLLWKISYSLCGLFKMCFRLSGTFRDPPVFRHGTLLLSTDHRSLFHCIDTYARSPYRSLSPRPAER